MATIEAPPTPPPSGPADEQPVAVPPARRRRWPWVLLAFFLLIAGAAAAGVAWIETSFPHAKLTGDSRALARLELPGMGTKLLSISVRGDKGGPVRVRLTRDLLWPRDKVRPGEHLDVTVVIRRPSSVAWLIGRNERQHIRLVVPATSTGQHWLGVRPGNPVRVTFAVPVRVLVVKRGHQRVWRVLQRPQRVVALPWSIAHSTTGRAQVQAAARPWERLSSPVKLTWFPVGHGLSAIIRPKLGGPITPAHPITMTFSAPVATVLGTHMPELSPNVDGNWQIVDKHTIRFAPAGLGYPFGAKVTLTLPKPLVDASAPDGPPSPTLSWQVPQPTTTRAVQLLAQLGYLPLEFWPAHRVPHTRQAQLAAIIAPPDGTWKWRWKHTPASLQALWQPDKPNTVVQGALMRFQDAHGMTASGTVDEATWQALVGDVIAGRKSADGYTYVMVSEQLPERLRLWHDGKVIYSALVNTGIGAAPTEPGTWPVFEHMPVGTMSGTNPDGSHYSDPGIPWISYFHGGDALHAFSRPGYGYPQSLGCVEMTNTDAGAVYPHTPIGTLVTVAG